MADYVRLLKWLTVQDRPELAQKLGLGSAESMAGDSVLRRLGGDAAAFADAVLHYSQRFFTAVGCPASLSQEARRRGRRRLHAPGRRGLERCRGG